ncbi:hypothetical protein [Pseudoxanthomonas wuyuanensis]
MFPGSSKRNQSSSTPQDSGYWFDLPDLTPRKTRRKRLVLFAAVLAAAAALLLIFILFGSHL